MAENIYPIFEKMLQRKDREALLKQKGIMIWFTGLSGSGKSTLAIALEGELYKQGILCRILDGDNIRSGINNNLGFSEADRTGNIRRIAEVSKLFVDCGIVTSLLLSVLPMLSAGWLLRLSVRMIFWKYMSVRPSKNVSDGMSKVCMPRPVGVKSRNSPVFHRLSKPRNIRLFRSTPHGNP